MAHQVPKSQDESLTSSSSRFLDLLSISIGYCSYRTQENQCAKLIYNVQVTGEITVTVLFFYANQHSKGMVQLPGTQKEVLKAGGGGLLGGRVAQ